MPAQVGQEKVERFTISVPGEMLAELDAARRAEPMVNGRGVKRSEWIQAAIREKLERERENSPAG